MKKNIAIVILAIFLIGIVGCSSSKLSPKNQEIAKQAVSVADRYSDGTISYDAASLLLRDLHGDVEKQYDDGSANATLLSTNLLFLRYAVEDGDMPTVREYRDKIDNLL